MIPIKRDLKINCGIGYKGKSLNIHIYYFIKIPLFLPDRDGAYL